MKKRNIFIRMVLPAVITLGVMVVFSNVYNLSGTLRPGGLQTVVVLVSAFLMFASIWLGPLFVNTFAFFNGASGPERLAASFVAPAAWIAKTYTYFIGIYSFGELAFLILHPLILGNIGVNLLCVGISELFCRRKMRSRGEPVPLFAAPNTLALVAGLLITFAGLWNGGHTYYYYFMDVYTWLFT